MNQIDVFESCIWWKYLKLHNHVKIISLRYEYLKPYNKGILRGLVLHIDVSLGWWDTAS